MNRLLAGALAIALSTGAGAQEIRLSGLLDAWIGMAQPPGSKRVAAVNAGGMSTSWWGIDGTEDLGDGLRVEFKLAGYLRNDTGAPGRFNGNETLFSRNAYVGISGKFGTLRIGRDGAPNFLPAALFNAFGDSFTFSPIVAHANVPLYNGTGWESVNAGDTGWSNQVRYTSPNLGGLTAKLHYQFGEIAGARGRHNAGASFLYFKGRHGVGGFLQRVHVDNPLPGTPGNVKAGYGRQDAWMVSGKTGVGPVTLYANYEHARNSAHAGAADGATSNGTSTTWSASADVAFGAGKLLAAFADTTWQRGPQDGRQRGTLSLGYDHSLSKRSDVYVVGMRDRIRGYRRGDTLALGLRTRF
ncbi:porin [Pseudoduganella lutea]|uniref:Porin n=1 Tax=Pseudoduganella lutea TaxID=321985 RepID=A0A4P6L357_9BURK|nr:porin [Pseudoduganella lutea]QBE65869.1 porin [Pseudoduganella lutea]